MLRNWWASFGANALPNFLRLPGSAGAYASTPDSVPASITGDIDIIWFGAATQWNNGAVQILVAKEGAAGQYGYDLYLNGDTLNFFITVDGTAVSVATADAAPSLVVTDGQKMGFRVGRIAASGDVIFTYSTDNGANWVAFGTTRSTTAGNIFDNTQPVEIGSRNTGQNLFTGRTYLVQIMNGIFGTVVVNFDPRQTFVGAASFTSSTGEVWTMNGASAIAR